MIIRNGKVVLIIVASEANRLMEDCEDLIVKRPIPKPTKGNNPFLRKPWQ